MGWSILQNSFDILGVETGATRDEIRTAYRKLARRWHPDRFAVGPERDWANERMAEINAAYRDCLDRATPGALPTEEAALAQAQQLIDDGQFSNARAILMGVTTRCAEWNYLFGALMMRTAEYEKGILYLSVAAHQRPDELKYARALEGAQRLADGRKHKLLGRLRLR